MAVPLGSGHTAFHQLEVVEVVVMPGRYNLPANPRKGRVFKILQVERRLQTEEQEVLRGDVDVTDTGRIVVQPTFLVFAGHLHKMVLLLAAEAEDHQQVWNLLIIRTMVVRVLMARYLSVVSKPPNSQSPI